MESNDPTNNLPETSDNTKPQHEGVDKPVKPYHTHVQHFINIPMEEDFDIDPARIKQMQKEWDEKLVGKKFNETEDEAGPTTFSKQQLPKVHRVLAPGSMATRDYRPGRLNVYIDEGKVCTHVTMG